MEEKIKKLTAPYIGEGLFGLLENAVIVLALFLLGLIGDISSTDTLIKLLAFSALFFLVLSLLFDLPMMIKSLLDRKKQEIITVVGEFENIGRDWNNSYKVRLSNTDLHTAGICVRYYPKSWRMERCRFLIKTDDGKILKLRIIASNAHGQYYDQSLMYSDMVDLGGNFVLKVRYLKYTKAIVDACLESYPESIDNKTLEHTRKTLAEITRWTVKTDR